MKTLRQRHPTQKNSSQEINRVPTHQVHTIHSPDSRLKTSYYNYYIPTSIRALFSFVATAGQTIIPNPLPVILLSEGYSIFRKNFGFTREKAFNNLLLFGISACVLSKFWINPWYFKKSEEVHAHWYQATNATISDVDYYDEFYSSMYVNAIAIAVFGLLSQLTDFLRVWLNSIITLKNQCEFVKEWLSNFGAYGINASNAFSDTAIDEEKTNLNVVKLFDDIKIQNSIINLWISRITSAIDFAIAFQALYTMSPPMLISFYFCSIILPKFIVLSFTYSSIKSFVTQILEKPMRSFYTKINQLQDKIIHQITNIQVNAEPITCLDGETFEAKKLLSLLDLKHKQNINYNSISSIKSFFDLYILLFEYLVPMLVSVHEVRSGSIEQEKFMTLSSHFSSINWFITWGKAHFEELNMIEESVRRLNLYYERLEDWKSQRIEIEKKIKDSKTISFEGAIYADTKYETLLAKGKFTLPAASITHINAPSGCGKTTLFRVFRGICSSVNNECIWSLPKGNFVFLPSQIYILSADEPLFQTVCYPTKLDPQDIDSNLNHKTYATVVQNLLRELELREHIYNNLTKLPLNENKESNAMQTANWMITLSEGERKRIAFCNVLLKLKTQNIQFLIMDEPFKGIDYQTQKKMVALLHEAMSKNSPSYGCTILFSNHEQNHGLNTHTLNIDENTKQYSLIAN